MILILYTSRTILPLQISNARVNKLVVLSSRAFLIGSGTESVAYTAEAKNFQTLSILYIII